MLRPPGPAPVQVPAPQSARDAGCRYVDDSSPGVKRVARGRSFAYFDAAGRRVADAATLQRIRALAIPPAWTGVWICPSEDGHLQATGRDARGRKQYRYHARFREARDGNKYGRLAAFAEALPKIRAAVERDLAATGIGRDKVLAAVVRLLELTRMRIGHEEYARQNGSYGLATLRDRHVDVEGGAVSFRFRGKSGKVHDVRVRDPRLARIVRRCTELPGEVLFQYLDGEGRPQPIEAADVNDYLRRVAGAEFGTKDFRTWGGTVLAAEALAALPEGPPTKAALAGVVKQVAGALGNTAAVCRRCYIHPGIIDASQGGVLRTALARATPPRRGLSAAENSVLRLLKEGP